ncbi:ADP-ribose diphosphatase [Enterobacteriaceae bacterium LUAb1]
MSRNQKSPISFCKSDVEIIARETAYQGFFSLKRWHFRHRLFNGEMSAVIVREIFERGHAVVMLPYDAIRDEVVLIEQIRIAVFDSSETPWSLELVAGMIEPGESIDAVARREAKEEAGLSPGRVKPIISYFSSTGGSSEKLFVMAGEVDASQASGIYGLAEENEDILVHVVSREQAYRWVETGVIDNAATIIALQWLELHYKQLQSEWKQE